MSTLYELPSAQVNATSTVSYGYFYAHEDLAKDRNELAHRWERETSHYSARWQIEAHSAFDELVRIAGASPEWAFERLRKGPISWILVLKEAVGEPPASCLKDDLRALRNEWFSWGSQNGFCS